jgi:hypothetical protein
MFVFLHKFIDSLRRTPARRNKLILISTGVGLLINILTWLLIYFKLQPLVINLPAEEAFIPLHYNIYLGVDLFGRWTRVFALPGIGLLFILVNTVLALFIYNRNEILSYLLTVSAAVIQVFLFVATIFTILINI